MFGLEQDTTILLLISLFAVFAFEFINGFHDTANAVATVIYTNALKPVQAVVWSTQALLQPARRSRVPICRSLF